MKLKLKPEYQSVRITIKHPKLGDVIFDSDINNEAEYPFFKENGFLHLFIDEEIEVNKVEIKPLIKKYKGIENNGEKTEDTKGD